MLVDRSLLLTRSLSFLLVAGCIAACSTPVDSAGSHAESSEHVSVSTQSLWANGEFESDSIGATPPTSWAVTTYSNPNGVSGSSSSPPSSFSALNLSNSGGKLETYVVGGTQESQIDPDLGSGQAFRFPRFGTRAARVNYKDNTDDGHNKNANGLSQTMTITSADIDPLDGRVHVRFAVAPVLENPSHGYTQQPYYFIELLNVTRGTTLYRDFNTAGQSGVPWITTTSIRTHNTVQWTNWQLVDLAPEPDDLLTGDQVKLTVVGSGCSLSGHFGRVYVDGTGASVPGLYTWASGPSSSPANTDITYVVHYVNGGSTSEIGTHFDMTVPPQTTYQSISGISNCTTPAVGGTGTITCPIGVLGAGASGTFEVTVHINSNATNKVVNGTYSIAAIDYSPLLGARVTTSLLASGTRYADVVVTQTANKSSLNWGDQIKYTIVIKNNGPNYLNAFATNQLSFSDVFPSQLTGVTWTCTATNNGFFTSCPAASGSGSISNHPAISPNDTLTYVVTATATGSGSAIITNTPTATPGSRPDPDLTNNAPSLSIPVGTVRTISLTKGTTGGYTAASGAVASTPSGLSCGTGCSSTTGSYVDGATVTLTATPVNGATFSGWSGDCSGSASTCTLTMSANRNVTANFTPAPATGAASKIYVYSGNNQRIGVSTAFASALTVLVTDNNGNSVNNVPITYTAVPVGGATATLTNPTNSNSLGLSTVTATANSTAGTYTVTAAITATPAVSTTFTLTNVGAPATIEYVSGGTATDVNQAPVSTAFNSPLMVLVKDSNGIPVPGATVNFSVPASGASATLSSSSATTDSDGHASVTATANTTAGTYTSTAVTSPSVGTTISFSMQNLASTPAFVYAYSGTPQDTPTSNAFENGLVALVTDSLGNSLNNVTVTFTAPSNSVASLKFSNNNQSITATTNALGLASISAPTANSIVGAYSVTASATGAVSATFSMANDGAQIVDVYSGSPQSKAVDTAFSPLTVIVTNSSTGAVVNNATVTFTAPSSGATAALTTTSTTTNASGIASVPATAGGTAGSYTVTAATSTSAPASFSLTNLAGAASAISISSGNSQRAAINTDFGSSLVAKVVDSHNNAVSGVAVTFTPPGSAPTASIIGSPATTDSSGLASVTAHAGATIGGPYNVAASATGTGTVNFSLTNDQCEVDSDCASNQYCNTPTHACTAKLGHGVAIPTVAGHSPTLNGTCTVAAGTSVCLSGVCDTADNKCGYANGDGPCTAGNGGSVCRGGACGSTLVCMPTGGCATAADCSLSNAVAACTSFACTVSSCTAGFGNCNGSASDGCETATTSNVNNCGSCGNVCNLANSTETCTSGSCGIGACDSGYANCNGTVADGCEKLIAGSDLNNCGGCGTVCDLANSTEVCSSGTCGIGSCDAGYGNCNGNAADGCELLTAGSDVNNCGSCGNVCNLANSTETCTAGSCGIGSCDSGYADCNGTVGDGCEKLIAGSDLNNCGGCGTVCAPAHASAQCTTGSCGIATCSTGYSNCNGSVGDGCEVLTGGSDLDNCGGCGTVCAPAHATAQCTTGSCGIAGCSAGYSNCNGSAGDGCEVLTGGSDLGNCGGCGTVCSPAHASGACTTGSCGIGSCDAGYADCDNNPANGCEVLIGGSDTGNCGGCGTVCAPAHATAQCASGICGIATCDTGYANCSGGVGDGCETHTAADTDNCGACGSVCSPANALPACTNGSCEIASCDSGYADCDSSATDGCEVHTGASDLGNCGGCGTQCAPAHASGACTTGSCGIDTCDPGYSDCDGSAGNGCEIHTAADTDNCGSCGGACNLAHAVPACTSGTCGIDSCVTDYADCNGNAPDGCEIHTAVDAANCGTCGNVCNLAHATAGCSASACTLDSCDAGYSNCDNVASNGCEVLTGGSDVTNCGGCGTTCQASEYCVAGACTTKKPNSQPCTDASECASGICDSDDECGLPDGATCATSAVCRGGACSVSGVCMQSDGCAVDGDCAEDEFCDTVAKACTPKLPNGTPVPTIAGHDPELTGACTPAVGAVVCDAEVCDTADAKCGYLNGDGPCSSSDAATVCRSEVCGSDAKCGYPNGEGSCDENDAASVCRSGICGSDHVCAAPPECEADSDCSAEQFCDTSVQHCAPKLPNGTPVPTIDSHDPALTGDCSTAVGSAVCSADVCDTSDDRCGYANGDGPCDGSNADSVCRSEVCGSDDLCGYPDGEGDCTSLNAGVVCRSGVCSLATHQCAATVGCAQDSDCLSTQFCDTVAHACTAKLPNDEDVPVIAGHTPELDGTCTPAVGASVCSSDVCDADDDKCGYRNGNGPCDEDNAGAVCRSGVCGSDELCGLPNFEGDCTSINAGVVCRSQLCSTASHVCVPIGGCLIDTDCTSDEFCDTGSHQCTSKLPNGTPIPSIGDHDPDLTGACTTDAANAVCVSAVCDGNDDECGYPNGRGSCDGASAATVCRSEVCGDDDKCGYPDGEGPCNSGNAATVCRSGSCSSAHVCVPPSGCAVDADCDTDHFCDTSLLQCTPKLANGTPIPSIVNHDPDLIGACDADVGSAVCAAAVCNVGDDQCGYVNGEGPCDSGNAATVCRSAVCGSDDVCGYPDGEGACTSVNASVVCRSGLCSTSTHQCLPPTACFQDSECTSTQFCNTATNVCTPKLPNGTDIPTIGDHTPELDGDCTSDTGMAVCSAGACDVSDDKCGYLNGDGPCDSNTAGAVCRSGVCGGDDLCGYPNFEGPCTSVDAGSVCRSGMCSASSHLCVAAGGCEVDADCSRAQFCNTASKQCVPKLPNGMKIPTVSGHTPKVAGACSTAVGKAVCSSSVCDADDDKCGYPNDSGSCTAKNAATVCRSGVCGSDGKCGYPDGDGTCTAKNAGALCRSEQCSDSSHICIGPHGCGTDADCSSTQFCDTAAGECRSKLGDGKPVPKIAHHDPALTGTCTAVAGKAVCRAGVCDESDDKCAFANGDGKCDAKNAASVCRSNACGSDGKCGYPDGEGACTGTNAGEVCRSGMCAEDTRTCGMSMVVDTGCSQDDDCSDTQFCNTESHACVAKLSDGAEIPVLDGHSPALDGACDADSGAAVCMAAVCDGSDDRCAFANGTGPCDQDDAGVVCRSNHCGSDGKCGLPDGEGPCTSVNAFSVCRSGVCENGVCGAALGCMSDAECGDGHYCDGSSHHCKRSKAPEGQCSSDAQCTSHSCDLDTHRCNACVDGQCGKLKLAGGGFGCSAAQPGTQGAAANSVFALLALLLLTTIRRRRHGTRA